MQLRKLVLIPLAVLFTILTGCTEKALESGLLVDPVNKGSSLAGVSLDLSNAIDAGKSPFFLVYQDSGNTKTAKDLAAEYNAMRQQYIKPLFTTDAEKKNFARKFLAKSETFEKMKNYDAFLKVVESKMGMSITDAANLSCKEKETSSLAAWGDYAIPPNGEWVYVYSSNGVIDNTNGLYCPNYGNSNAICNNTMTWNPGHPVQLWGRLVCINESYSTGAGVFGYYEPPLTQNSSSSGSITKQVSFTATPGSAYIITSQANLYQCPVEVMGLIEVVGFV